MITKPKTRKAPAAKAGLSPIRFFALIAAHKALDKECWDHACYKLDDAESRVVAAKGISEMSERENIRRWRERAEKIKSSGYDLEKAIELAKEIHRFSASTLHSAAGSFLAQLEGKKDDRKLAIARNDFYRIFRILQEEEDGDTTIDDKTFFRENPLRCYRARLATSHEAFQMYGMLDAKAQHDLARRDRFVHVIIHWDRQNATVQKLFLVLEPQGDMDESQARAAFKRRDAETVIAGKVESIPS